MLALAAKESFALDFFSHLDRVREFCNTHSIPFREAAARCLVVPQPSLEQSSPAARTLRSEDIRHARGCRDANTEIRLWRTNFLIAAWTPTSPPIARYTFCAVCEPDDGWVTVLSDTLWPSEVIRRVRPALQPFDVYIARPQ